ncbi:MAG TPA: cupin domain-containing protein [Terriglobia bacterium]|nr:cupin domain-containing protein [Terriglobia bacterium]
MNCSRREWCLGLTSRASLAALTALVTTHAEAHAAATGALPSRAYRFEDLPAHTSAGNTFRPVLDGELHTGAYIELHESDLAPGAMPHPAHHHLHEEMFLIREGSVEVTIAGKSSSLGPGSVAYVASNQEHGIRNAGTTDAQYFVLAFGKDEQ